MAERTSGENGLFSPEKMHYGVLVKIQLRKLFYILPSIFFVTSELNLNNILDYINLIFLNKILNI